jgi:formylglycine-generating enzyme required for sulfatase activity
LIAIVRTAGKNKAKDNNCHNGGKGIVPHFHTIHSYTWILCHEIEVKNNAFGIKLTFNAGSPDDAITPLTLYPENEKNNPMNRLIITFIVVIGFSMVACGDDDGNDLSGGGTTPAITTTTLLGGIVETEYSYTLTATGDWPITWSVASGSLPTGLSLTGSTISGTPSAANTFTFTVKAANSSGSDTKSLSITITDGGDNGGVAPTITTTTLPGGTVGEEYSETLAADGDTTITWSWSIDIESGSGALPTGLSLASTGAITGMPTVADTFTFTVKAENDEGEDTKELSITITANPVPPTITTTTLPGGTVGAAYSQTLAADGDAPITWSWSIDIESGSGALPTGLSLASTGVITGTPTATNTFTFTVKAENDEGEDTKELSITIIEPPEMVFIQPGTFTMGSPDNEPSASWDETQHEVTLTGFYMGKYQVTQAQYQAVTGTNPSFLTTPVFPEPSTEKRPVERVTWYDALVFCNKLSMQEGLSPAYRIRESTDPAVWGTVPTSDSGTWDAVQIVAGSNGYRLPTEAQWEYACRAGTETAFNTGNNITTAQANYDGELPYYTYPEGIWRGRTTEVGSFAPNAWDLYDMHGNVREWCWDWFDEDYYSNSPAQDPPGPEPVSGYGRINRGGSWNSSGQGLRSAFRMYDRPYNRNVNIGFRLVRPVS